MRSLAYPLAVLVVVAVTVGLVGAASAIAQWGRWMVATGGALGIAGLALTGAGALNLAVPRTCAGEGATADVNRPAISLVLDGGDCFRSAVAQLQLTALVGVGSSLGVAAANLRRSGGGASGASTAARHP